MSHFRQKQLKEIETYLYGKGAAIRKTYSSPKVSATESRQTSN